MRRGARSVAITSIVPSPTAWRTPWTLPVCRRGVVGLGLRAAAAAACAGTRRGRSRTPPGTLLPPAVAAFAQQPAPPAAAPAAGGAGRAGGANRGRPPLFFKEEWKQTEKGGEHPVDPAIALSNPNLELKLYGPAAKEFLMTGAANDE